MSKTIPISDFRRMVKNTLRGMFNLIPPGMNILNWSVWLARRYGIEPVRARLLAPQAFGSRR
jgi:hypothetical protein